ncbi:hypothetical protein OSTOST_13273, partial [Ostertagia ostertagi]
RERALSSSSNESYTYIPQLPTTVFHAPTGTGASRASTRRQMVSFANVASRLRAAVRQSDGLAIGTDGLESSASHLTRSILDRRDLRPREDSGPPFQIQENFLARLDSGSSAGGGMSSRFRFLSELGLAVLPTGGTNPIPLDYAAPPARPNIVCEKELYETSGEMILLAFRDLFATFLVMLPFAFTMGWLPQYLPNKHLSGTGSSSRLCCAASGEQNEDERIKDSDELDVSDPLPGRLREAVVLRARHDVLFSAFLSLLVFALHSTSLFTATQPYFTAIIIPICIAFGIMNHYLYEQLRTHTPWKLIAKPILHSHEYTQFESPDEAKLMNFEIIHVWMLAIEKNL